MSDETRRRLCEEIWPADVLKAFAFGSVSLPAFVETTSNDPLTLQQVVDAVAFLRDANVPASEGYYPVFVHPDTAVDFEVLDLVADRPERVRDLTWSLLGHERRRHDLGKRDARPTAREVFDRALRVEEVARC